MILVLTILSLSRLKVSRDLTRERPDDGESILAFNEIGRGPLFGLIRYVVIQRLKRYRPQGLLMDAGCGPGYLALSVARQFPQLSVLGIDISPETLELAAQNRSAAKLDTQIIFQQADVLQLPVESNSIDFAVSTLSLHHWLFPDKAFSEVNRVLKPGGQLLFFDLRRDMPRLLYYVICFSQRFFAPSPIHRVNGGVGSVLSSLTPSEIEKLPSLSFYSYWKVDKGWGWVYIWGQK
jgi:ubiquinone/menaquinone biosynthesis C-methylase UbiE